MRFSIPSAILALAALGSTHSSASGDRDGSVWRKLDATRTKSQSVKRFSNRPYRRQTGWNPPSDLVTPLKEVWDHTLETYSNGDLYSFKNYGWDQLEATKGAINYCVRWDSTETVTEAQREQIATAVAAQYQQWFEWVYGFDNFPYSNISVNVVGWAVKDASLLEGSTEGLDVYTDTLDADGVAECDPACGRAIHYADGDYSGCAAGDAGRYDQSLWLTEGLEGGFGGDWGQQVGRAYFMELLGQEHIHILLHEMGHTFGLDDFYDWTPTGQDSFIMLAGSAFEITDFDGWMLRNWWYELSRNRGWQS